MLHSHLEAIVNPARLQLSSDVTERLILARDIATFTVAFSTTIRQNELTRMLIQRMLRLPNHGGFLCNFQWGKTMGDGADQLLTMPYDDEFILTCPVRAIERLVDFGTHVGWDMTTGCVLPSISAR